MSDIPKSKRAWSKLEAADKALDLRKKLNRELLMSFGLSDKHFEAAIKAQTKWVKDEKEKQALEETIRGAYEGYLPWYLGRHRDRVDDLCCDICQAIREANSIWPTYFFEYQDRRQCWNSAIKDCGALQDELQYIAESLPSDKNRFCGVVLEVDDLVKMLKKLRQSDNRFLKYLKPAAAPSKE